MLDAAKNLEAEQKQHKTTHKKILDEAGTIDFKKGREQDLQLNTATAALKQAQSDHHVAKEEHKKLLPKKKKKKKSKKDRQAEKLDKSKQGYDDRKALKK